MDKLVSFSQVRAGALVPTNQDLADMMSRTNFHSEDFFSDIGFLHHRSKGLIASQGTFVATVPLSFLASSDC